MKTDDLRIGNFVTIDNSKHHPYVKDKTLIIVGIEDWKARPSVSLMHLDPKENYVIPSLSQHVGFLEPILLNPEWFKKFGFHPAYHKLKGEHSHLPTWYNLNGFRINIEYYSGSEEVCHYELDINPATELKYVHQLQNIFYALNGKELEL